MEISDNRKSCALVEVIDNGPLKITGLILLKDLKKDITESLDELYLCRCGHSCNRPYCDGSHKK